MKRVLFFLIIFLISIEIFAQGEANHWFFGENIKLSFTTHDGEPVELDNEDTGFFDFSLGAATISDKDGNLLFFTNGDTVWNRNYEIMKNGLDTSKGDYFRKIIILQKPGSENLYYIVSTRRYSTGPPPNPYKLDSLLFNIVDMSGDKGLGEVLSWNNLIYSGPNCKNSLEATFHNNWKDIWILCSTGENQLAAFLLDENGIDKTPHLSYYNNDNNIFDFYHILKISPDGKKLVAQWGDRGSSMLTYIYDFNNELGTIHNFVKIEDVIIDSISRKISGAEFSCDGSYLFISLGQCRFYLVNTNKCQYIMDYDDEKDLNESIKIIGGKTFPHGEYYSMQLASNGKIYYPFYKYIRLGAIGLPHKSGRKCRLNDFEIFIKNVTDGFSYHFLPNFLSNHLFNIRIHGNEYYCEGDSIHFWCVDMPQGKYEWTGPDGFLTDSTAITLPNACAAHEGKYYLSLEMHNGRIYRDSLEIEIVPPPPASIRAMGETRFCEGESLKIRAEPYYDFWDYQWSTGETNQEITVAASGTYTLTVTNEHGCTASDEIVVESIDVKVAADSSLNFGKVLLGNNAHETITIRNDFEEEISVENCELSGDVVFSVTGGFPRQLLPGETCTAEVYFHPDGLKAFCDTAFIRVSRPCPKSLPVLLSGQGGLGLTVSIPDTSTAPGTNDFGIPLFMRISEGDSACHNLSYEAGISFDKNIFMPVRSEGGTLISNTIDGNNRRIKIQGIVDMIGAEAVTAATIYGIATPSPDMDGRLFLDSVLVDKPVDINRANGYLRPDNVGVDDDPGIISQPEFIIYPNPAEGEITIEMELEKAGALDITLVNTLGQTVYKVSSDAHTGKFTKAIRTDALPAGMYFIRARSGGKAWTAPVAVE